MPLSNPNPEQVAAERLAKAGGESSPPAASPRRHGPKPGTKYKPRQKSSPEPQGVLERSPEEVAASVKACSFMAGTLWNVIVAKFTKHRALTPEEADQLGAALDPVLDKYLPNMGGYGAELALIVVAGSLWISTEPPKVEKGPDGGGADLEIPAPDERTVVR